MNTNETLIPVQEIGPSRFRKRTVITVGVAAIVTVASLAAVVRDADDETVRPSTPARPCRWTRESGALWIKG